MSATQNKQRVIDMPPGIHEPILTSHEMQPAMAFPAAAKQAWSRGEAGWAPPEPADPLAANQYKQETQVLNQGCCAQVLSALSYVLIVLFPPFWCASFRTIKDYERAIIFRLGKFTGSFGPGLVFVNPLLDSIVVVDLRVETVKLIPQQMMTKDSVTCTVDAVVYTKVIDPVAAVLRVDNHREASRMLAATTLRSAIGNFELDELLTKRQDINNHIKGILQRELKKWGMAVPGVECKNIVLPQNMQRAMAMQAEAERERRAKIIAAEGEAQAAEQLAVAARTITSAEGALHLRYLQTLRNIATEKNSTIIFPLPMDLMGAFRNGRAQTMLANAINPPEENMV